ncbi:MAG: uroporphyrinogen-III [Beijerinckiaceae bacterium]|nr:MAG: uroporphyrinogen-III [Beijerinckiaceae bacterium]
MTGFVSFVSSGPGDPELLTLKAVKRIRDAEVILHDHLSTIPVAAHAQPGTKLVNVGKRAGHPSTRQDDINRLLVKHAKTGARVVRLKSGDAGIFGRLEEELIALTTVGIRFEIIPGVSAASAAAAAVGIPLTRRMTARRVQFFTGHDITGGFPNDVNIGALADPAATSVVYMAKATFPALTKILIAAGLSPDTPALLAEAVSTPQERSAAYTIDTLANHLIALPPEHDAPTLIIYGPLATPSISFD